MADVGKMPDWLADKLLSSMPLCPVEVELHTGPLRVEFVNDQPVTAENPLISDLLGGVRVRSCQGISPAVAAELAEGIRKLAPADPEHDVMAGIREAMKLADRMPPRRELHCAQGVATALLLQAPTTDDPYQLVFGSPTWLAGIDVIVEADMEPGRWELREGGTVIDSGQLEEL